MVLNQNNVCSSFHLLRKRYARISRKILKNLGECTHQVVHDHGIEVVTFIVLRKIMALFIVSSEATK